MILRVLPFVLLSACAISCAYWLVALACLRATLRRRPGQPAAFSPVVSVLKPVKGIDAGAEQNFQSFCVQDYPRFEIVFGVADRSDPAVAVIEKLIRERPENSVRLVVTPPLGTNPKAAILHTLSAEARGEVFVITDSDIRVGPDFLRRVVAPLAGPGVGLVTCLYRGQNPASIPARLEALHMDATFAPSAALANTFGATVGLGAAMVMRRPDLARAGGYARCADHLLDDYAIAAHLRGLGLGIRLSDQVVSSVFGPTSFAEQWSREVRWSRGIRAATPPQYPGLLLTFTVPIALAACAMTMCDRRALMGLSAALLVRWFVAWQCARLLGQTERAYLVWLPVRDVMSAAVWAAGLLGKTVTWRGQKFVLRRDGRLQPPPALPAGPLARAVRRLDAYLRRHEGIFEFTQDPRCAMRVHVGRAAARLQLSDGTWIAPGDPIGILHLWNEHLPLTPPGGADLRWGMQLRKALRSSLECLAAAAQSDPRLNGVKAFYATGMFVTRDVQLARLAARFGFDLIPQTRPLPFSTRLHQFGENFLILGLQWAFNPGGLRGKVFFRPRESLWMSTKTLQTQHGNGGA